MNLSDALNDVRLLGIEAAPFIYFVEQNPRYLDRVLAIFQKVQDKRLELIASAITLTEVLVMPIQSNHAFYEREYREMLLNTEGISTVSVTPSVAQEAARLRAKYHLRTPDALHLATALLSNCDAFLTNDFGFKRVEEIRILVLDEIQMDLLPKDRD